MSNVNQADDEGSPQFKQKKKLGEERAAIAKAKAKQTVAESWIELVPRTGKFGGKVRQCKRMAPVTYKDPETGETKTLPGNVHRLYIGKEAHHRKLIEKAKADKTLIVVT